VVSTAFTLFLQHALVGACHLKPDHPYQATRQYSCRYHRIPGADFTLNLDAMSSLLAQVQNYAPADETRTMIQKMIQERGVYLDSNRSLLESARIQKDTASKTVKRLRQQLAEAERAEIVAIHSFEAAMKTVSDIEDTIATHKALIHPIRYLSSGILCQIFEWCTADDDHAGNMRIAIQLSSVCRTWRVVAHSLGPLWRHIDYALWDPSVEDIFTSFLERSPYYLNVHIKVDRYRDFVFPAPFSSTNFKFDRIRTLIIHMHSGGLFHRFWPTPLHNLAQLKVYGSFGPSSILRGDCLFQCQNLEELELEAVEIAFTDDFVLPGLAQISLYEYSRTHFTSFCLQRLFEHAPHLKSFSLLSAGPMKMDESLSDHSFQPLRELTSLRIEYPSLRHAMTPFLEDPSLAPSLQHLTIASIDGYGETGLHDLLVQNATTVSLTKLTLEVSKYAQYAQYIPDDVLVHRLMVLRHFQYVERLEVVTERHNIGYTSSHYSKYFITCLFKVLSECTAHPIFPSLRSIRFLGCEEISVDNIIEMVKARMVAVRVSPEKLVPLESITFEDCKPLNVDDHRRLNAALGRNSF
jgi:hypothetical protein